MTALAIQKKDYIIQRVAKGDLLASIASEFGISRAAISQNLANDPDYKHAREIGAEARLELHYGEIAAAQDMLNLARAREGFKSAAWFAEREFPHRWGQKSEVTVTHNDLGDRIRRSRERTIEGEVSQPALPNK